MRTLICHPDNMEILKKQLTPVSRRDPRIQASLESTCGPLDGIKCISDPYMERTRKTGQYVMPDGNVSPKDQVRFGDRFCEYGPEDIELALFMGWITEEETLVYYMMQEPVISFGTQQDFTVTAPKWTSITKGWAY